MCVYILSREILAVSKERNVINIHAMRNVVYVGFSKRQIMTKEILFFKFCSHCSLKPRR